MEASIDTCFKELEASEQEQRLHYENYSKLTRIMLKQQNEANQVKASPSNESQEKLAKNLSRMSLGNAEVNSAVIQRIHACKNHMANINRSTKNQKHQSKFLETLYLKNQEFLTAANKELKKKSL